MFLCVSTHAPATSAHGMPDKQPVSCHVSCHLHFPSPSFKYFPLDSHQDERRSNTPFTRYNRLSNRFDNRVERTATVRSTSCQTGLYNQLDNRSYTRYSRLSNQSENRLYRVYKHLTGCQASLTTGCIV